MDDFPDVDDPLMAAMIDWATRWDVDRPGLADICTTLSDELGFLAFVLASFTDDDNVRWQQRQYAGAGSAELRQILVEHVFSG